MSKDKNKYKSTEVQVTKGSPIQKVTDSLNKRGQIKGNTKKETRALKGLCVHHKLNKKGKVKPDISNHGNGECSCNMCEHTFSAKIPSHDKVVETIDEMIRLNNQAKFMAVAVDSGDETIKYFAAMGVQLMNYRKTYEKLKNVAERQENIKKGKNKGKGRNDFNGGSTNYGSWS